MADFRPRKLARSLATSGLSSRAAATRNQTQRDERYANQSGGNRFRNPGNGQVVGGVYARNIRTKGERLNLAQREWARIARPLSRRRSAIETGRNSIGA